MGAAVAAAVAGWPAEGIAGFNVMQRAPCVEPRQRAAIGVAGSRAAHRGAIDGVESSVEAAPVGARGAGAAAGVTEGISRAARKTERPSELVAPRPAHRWPRGAAAPRILARHTSAPQRPARGDRQLLGPAESRGNGAGARLGPHRVRGHRCGRLKRLQGGRFPKETSRAMRGRREAAAVLPRQQPPQHPAGRAASVRPRGGCCPAAKRMLPGRQADAARPPGGCWGGCCLGPGGCCPVAGRLLRQHPGSIRSTAPLRNRT